MRRVAVIGSGISGAVCASSLARSGISVNIFDSARGRMSQRRETSADGKELLFDHGAPFFTVGEREVSGLLQEWERKGLIAEWRGNFGSFDFDTHQFVRGEQEACDRKYVGVPGMNSTCC